MDTSKLLLAQAATFLAWVFFVGREVRVNAAMIVADGAADTLHQGFHRRRTGIRALTAGTLVVVGSLPAWGVWPAAGLSMAALLVLLLGYFVRTFNPMLNRARGLDYVARFYVSSSPGAAAFPDQYIWRKVGAANPGQPQAALQYRANEANQRLLNLLFWACLTGYMLLLLAVLWLS